MCENKNFKFQNVWHINSRPYENKYQLKASKAICILTIKKIENVFFCFCLSSIINLFIWYLIKLQIQTKYIKYNITYSILYITLYNLIITHYSTYNIIDNLDLASDTSGFNTNLCHLPTWWSWKNSVNWLNLFL